MSTLIDARQRGRDKSADNRARFLQKPYTRINLARTIRETLDGTGEVQRTGRSLAV
jgi:hypothetical protein